MTPPQIILTIFGLLISIIGLIVLIAGGRHLHNQEHGEVKKTVNSGLYLIGFGVLAEVGGIVAIFNSSFNWAGIIK